MQDTLFQELAQRRRQLDANLWRLSPLGKIESRPSLPLDGALDEAISHFSIDAASRSKQLTDRNLHLVRFENRHGSQCTSIYVASFEAADERVTQSIEAALTWSINDLKKQSADTKTLMQLTERLEQSYEENHVFFRLARLLNSVESPHNSLAQVMAEIHGVMPFGWIALRFPETSPCLHLVRGRLLTHGDVSFDPNQFAALADDLLCEAKTQPWARMHQPEMSPIATLVGSEILAEPVHKDGHTIGVLLAGDKRGDDAQLSTFETQFVSACADFIGVFHQNASRFAEQRAMFLGTLSALTAAIDAKDPYTRGHWRRIALLGSMMARAMKLPEDEIEQYRIAGLVHDVGKIGVPEAVLRKPARLTDEEFALIKQHPSIGHAILKDIPSLEAMLPGVRHHHEQWCGRGYPDRLAGETIPLVARVLALADTFDAMSSDRAYRAALTREFVLGEITKCAGNQFDPALVPIFVSLDFTPFDVMVANHQSVVQQAA